MSYETLTYEPGPVTRVGLNRPDKLNAFNLRMLRELCLAYAAFEADAEARCLLLFAHGRSFTAGLELTEVGPAVASGEELFPADGVDPLDLRAPRRKKPVVAAVQGHCFTIGIELLLACDVRVASADTRFAQMEVQRGIMPFGGATLRFPLLCGWGNAMRWLLTGERFDAAEALRLGLVQQVAEPEQALAVAAAIAESIAAQAPLAVRATRESARRAVEEGREAALGALMEHARGLFATEDAQEGVRSFVERRTARFAGR